MSASYPPVGTRVRWTYRGKAREGVVVVLTRDRAREQSADLSFRFSEVFGWDECDHRYMAERTVVEVDTVDGHPRKSTRRYYHPRPQWLEVVEEAP